METSKIKNWIIICLITCVAFLATCEFSKNDSASNPITQDTLFLSQYRQEKKQKIELIASYEKRVDRLQLQKDSLQKLVKESSRSISVYRVKAKVYQNQFKAALEQLASIDSLQPDTLSPILDSMIVNQAYSDTACDDTIDLLQITVANRDSALFLQKQIDVNLRDLNKEAELRNQFLTDQLNTAYKVQKKKTRQNKLLAGGLLILSGITTSLLLIHSTK